MEHVSVVGIERDIFLKQVLMDIDDAATRENTIKLVPLQLVVARATAHDNGFNVQIVQRIGHTMEQHAVVRDHLFGLVKLAAAALRVATTQVARWQHCLNAGVPQHGLSGQPHLTEQTFRATARKIKHSLSL